MHVEKTFMEVEEGKRRLNTMHSIKTTLSWLFPHAKCKRHFFILTFCIAMQLQIKFNLIQIPKLISNKLNRF
jgi:hypothetical protein